MAGKEPTRTCVGCRATAPKRSLVRLAKDDAGTVRVDPAGTSPGRGAYVHQAQACIDLAFRRGGLIRAFRVRPDPAGAARLMQEAFEVAGVTG